VPDRITRGWNAIFGHVARLSDKTPTHHVLLHAKSSCQAADLQIQHGNVSRSSACQVDRSVPPRRQQHSHSDSRDASYWSRSFESDATVQADYALMSTTTSKLFHTATPDMTKLSCLCRVRFGGVNWIPDNSRLSPTENLKSEHVKREFY